MGGCGSNDVLISSHLHVHFLHRSTHVVKEHLEGWKVKYDDNSSVFINKSTSKMAIKSLHLLLLNNQVFHPMLIATHLF